MAMIKAILHKFAENPDYNSAMEILDRLSETFVTNIPKSDYLKTFNVVVDLLPALENMEPKSMEGEYKWHMDEIRTQDYRYYFYPAEGETERVRKDIERIKAGK